MPAWMTHYLTVAACLDAAPCPPVPDREMSDEVFQALVDGRLDEVEDQIEELPEWGQRPQPVSCLADDPLRAIALAGLCRALPDSEAITALTAVGTVTVLHCPPGTMTDTAASLLAALLAPGNGRPPVQIIVLRMPVDAKAKDRPSAALEHAMAAISASTTPHVLLIEQGVPVPGEVAAMLPAPLRIGPVDGWLIAAALSLRGGGAASLRKRLPDDAALRALSPGQLRFALRHRIRDRQIDELHRLVRSNRSNSPTLDDIVGYGEAEQAARRLVSDLAVWSAGRAAWSDMTRSLLFCGPPGTGKTWLARALAASAGVPLIEGSFSTWQAAGHLGHMLGEMRASFAAAQAAAPAILFLDEIDSAGDRNSVDHHAENYRRQVINSLLELLDGAGRTPGVIIVAACNDVDALDPAIRRPGRIDRIVEVPPPGHTAIVHILARRLDGQLPGREIDRLARRAIGQSAAAIDGALREARSRARADSRAAPPLAGPPARTRAWPWLYLCGLADVCFPSRPAGEGPGRLASGMSNLGQIASSLTGRRPRLSGLRSLQGFNPMSATINSPHSIGPSPIRWPGLGLSKATVSRAGLSNVPRPGGRAGALPLSMQSPLGQSTATTRLQ